ncbi:imidazoleglycerol-phosphate dehydratase HisB [candidate division BRC1 bacterium HGW-BRC1-1]|jgi:imidazoleglycerol-phosphate dehydratase|nr:MAG: imidazoleglycerol-phosphate dehydratase HisB [candidate division BRC1 bacterium HGW-BRC1-1]
MTKPEKQNIIASQPTRSRTAKAERNTSETQLSMSIDIDGSGAFTGSIGVPFFEHMLNLFTRHALLDIQLSGIGDVHIDAHHTVEDCGILLGQIFKQALGDKAGINRYGDAHVPMEEALARCVLDLCNRPYLRFDVELPKAKVGEFDVELAEEFLRAFVFNAGITMHITVFHGSNLHHILEAVFKSVGLALSHATGYNPRIRGVLSTKGKL